MARKGSKLWWTKYRYYRKAGLSKRKAAKIASRSGM